MRHVVVTIDGPAGSGKSTVARELARRLGVPMLNTGALYRAVAWLAERAGIDPDDEAAVTALLDATALTLVPDEQGRTLVVEVDGQPLPEQELRAETIGVAASRVAAHPEVRRRLLPIQRTAAARYGLVAEGRDTGSVVFPDAPFKFFLSADLRERARRRALELGRDPEDPAVLAALVERDRRDSERAAAPLVAPPEARVIDSTGRSVAEVVAEMLESVHLRDPETSGRVGPDPRSKDAHPEEQRRQETE